jgi:hypothetical protein
LDDAAGARSPGTAAPATGLVEGDGFELSVPREEKPTLRDGLCRFFPTLPFREGPNPSAFASRNVSAGNSGTLGYLQDDLSIPQPLSGSAGDLIDHAGVRSRCVAPSPSTAWRRASRRALRCGQPACAWKWRRRHGSGEPPCEGKNGAGAAEMLEIQTLRSKNFGLECVSSATSTPDSERGSSR